MRQSLSVAAVVLLAACVPEDDGQAVDFMIPVSVEEVRLGTVEEHVLATGTLRAPEVVSLTVETGGALQVMAREDGRRLGEGDRVRAGDVIARITGEDVRLAVRLAANQQRHDAALHELEAAQRLFERQLINQTELERLRATYQDAKLELERSLRTEERNRLVTPIDGVILSLARNADGQLMANGQLVSPGQALAQIAPIDTLIADVDLVGRDLARVGIGTAARVRYHAWDQKHFQGELIRLAPVVDRQTRALQAEVAVDNRNGLLRPGMFVEVILVVARNENVPVVPRNAITVRGGRQVVFVHVGQRVEARTLVPGLSDNDVVEARAGVDAGERVVVSGTETLSDQARVRVSGL